LLGSFPCYASEKRISGRRDGGRKKKVEDEEDEKAKESIGQILARKVTSRTAVPVLIGLGILYVVGTALQSFTIKQLPDTLQVTMLAIVLVILCIAVAFCMCIDATRWYLAGKRAHGGEPSSQ